MAKHAHRSSSVRGIPLRNLGFDELPLFSLGLTQDEDINLISTNIQSKRGVSIEEVRSKQHNNSEKIVESMKWKAFRESSSPKSSKIQKLVKRGSQSKKQKSSKITTHVSSDYESEEKKVEKLAKVIPLGIVACKFYENKGVDIDNYSNYKFNDKMNLFDVFLVENLPQQPNDNLDCDLYMMTYAECLTFGEGVPNVDFDLDLVRMRYASMLWHYGTMVAHNLDATFDRINDNIEDHFKSLRQFLPKLLLPNPISRVQTPCDESVPNEEVGCHDPHQDVVVDLPRVKVFESPYCDTLGDIRSRKDKTLVVLLPINKSTHTLVDPCENQGESTLVYELPTTSKDVQNDQLGENDLNLFESIGNPNYDYTCENVFGCNPLDTRDSMKISAGYPFKMEYDRNLFPWLLVSFDPSAILEYGRSNLGLCSIFLEYDPFAAHDSLCLCRDYSLERESVACLEMLSTPSSGVSYVEHTNEDELENSKYLEEDTLVGFELYDTFVYLFMLMIFSIVI
ncbi:hypothetical protein BC332_01062 [Capsicum chinense]|nr:hypothetical protein BC332_01062 [Capsicum chinense]